MLKSDLVKSSRRERQVSGAITLADVAKLAGVAVVTASRSLNNPELVSPDTLQRVRDAVSRTGYVPNLLAGGLASRRSRLVATILPTLSGPVFAGYIDAITETLGASGYQVMLGQSGYADSREDDLLAAIISRRPDGIILTGIVHSPAGRRRLASADIPIVETWDLTPTPIDMLVGFSHEKVGAAVAEFFHARGYKRPGLVSANDTRALLRSKGFTETAQKLGATEIPAVFSDAPALLGHGRAGLAELLGKSQHIDAVFCSSDFLALGVIIEAQSRGIRIPEQLGIVGFGDLNFAADLNPTLTTVRIDGEAIGRHAAKFVIDMMSDIPIPNRIKDVGFSIIERASA
jgi:LacI family gluconate utilization system Gnt-I transcriptional repressor